MLTNIKTEKEIAQMLKTNPRRIALWRKAGLIQGIKTGRQWIYKESDINYFVDKYKGKDLSSDHYLNLKGR